MTEPFTSLDDTPALDGLTLSVRCEPDDDNTPPWKQEDGHGPVTGWTNRAPCPGERVLNKDYGSYRYYDFAAAVRISRRDGWGVPAYRLDTEHGVNGLVRVTGQWFKGRELETHRSQWCDDINEAIREVYDANRATYPTKRAYAAAAAEADFARLKAWCEDDWYYVGVIVTASREGIELGSASLWGIESDAEDYLVEVANELAEQAVEEAQAKLARLCACPA